jgi:hypothetical protein
MGRQGPLHPRGGWGAPTHCWRSWGPIEHRMNRIREGATRKQHHGNGGHSGVSADHRAGCQGLEPHRTDTEDQAQQCCNSAITTAVLSALHQLPLQPYLPQERPDATDSLYKDRVAKVGGGQTHGLGSPSSLRCRPKRHMAASPSAREIRGAHPVTSNSLRESRTLAATSKGRSGKWLTFTE